MPSHLSRFAWVAPLFACAACDEQTSPVAPVPSASVQPAAPSAQAAPPEPPRAPEIIVDPTNVSVGLERVPAAEPALADRVGVLVTGRPAIAGQVVDFVAMRNARPSHVAAVASALRRAGASGANVKTEARDGTTVKLPLSFATSLADCATVAWIAKDAAVDVWPVGGGTAKRIVKGMAGPDMTLGGEAIERQARGCGASELLVGADEHFSWGLVFDLATMAVTAPGARVRTAVLTTRAVPGRRWVVEPQ